MENTNTSTAESTELLSMPVTRTTIYEFSDDDIRKAFTFASGWSWFQQPGKTIFADRLYHEGNAQGINADLAEAMMRFLDLHNFIIRPNKMKWVIRKPFTSDLIDAACVAVAREKLGRCHD